MAAMTGPGPRVRRRLGEELLYSRPSRDCAQSLCPRAGLPGRGRDPPGLPSPRRRCLTAGAALAPGTHSARETSRWCSGKKNPSANAEMKEMLIRSLGWDDSLEEERATLSSILAWKIPWMEEPGGLQSTGSQRVGYH